MDKKDNIDTLIKQYLNFYQQNSQKVELDQETDFDNLMRQYKSKFDKQIANEQQAIREKEEARVKQKKLENDIQNQKRERQKKLRKEKPQNNIRKTNNDNSKKSNFRQTYQRPSKNYSSTSHKSWIILIIVALVAGFIFLAFNSKDKTFDNNYAQLDLSEQLDTAVFNEPSAASLKYIDNIDNDDNFTAALAYLNYVNDGTNYKELIDISIDSDNFLIVNNNTDYYLYLEYTDDQYNCSLLIAPNEFYYDGVINRNEVIINTAAFYSFEDPALAQLGSSIDIYTTLNKDEFSEANADIIFKHHYFTSCLNKHYDSIIYICESGSNKGYYGYLDYTARQIKIYYSDDLDNDIAIEDIQNYQSDYLKTITL